MSTTVPASASAAPTAAAAGLLSSQPSDRSRIPRAHPEYKVLMQTVESFFLSQSERDKAYEQSLKELLSCEVVDEEENERVSGSVAANVANGSGNGSGKGMETRTKRR